MTLIAVKLDEMFTGFNKSFLFFDKDADQYISRTEFYKGIDGLKIKLQKVDMDLVFDYLDSDLDDRLNYNEFCGLTEEKRRNIDPFENFISTQKMKKMGLEDQTMLVMDNSPPSSLRSGT